MLKIIGPSISPFVVKVLAAADYKQLAYTHQDFVSTGELSQLNPGTGKIPIVISEGEVVYDSTLILRHFDQLQPSPALLSDDPAIAAQQRMLEDWSDESFYWYNQALRWCPKNEARTIAQNTHFVPKLARSPNRSCGNWSASNPRHRGWGACPTTS